LYFVYSPFTAQYSCNHLSANALQKTSKNGVFSTKNIFVQKDALNLGSKFEYFLTILRPAEFAIRKHRDGAVVMSTSKRTIKNCLPLNWRHGRQQANKKPELSQALAY